MVENLFFIILETIFLWNHIYSTVTIICYNACFGAIKQKEKKQEQMKKAYQEERMNYDRWDENDYNTNITKSISSLAAT